MSRARSVMVLSLALCQGGLGACHLVSSFEASRSRDASVSRDASDSGDSASLGDAAGVGDLGGGDLDAAVLLPDGTMDAPIVPTDIAQAETCLPWPDEPKWLPIEEVQLNLPGDRRGVSLSPNQLDLYFASTAGGGHGGSDIYRATRPDLLSPFGDPEPLPEPVNSPANEYRLALGADGKTVFVSSDRDSGNPDIWWGTVGDDGSFEGLVRIEEIWTKGAEHDPWIDATGKQLYFGRQDDGVNGIWTSRRAEGSSSTWGEPELLRLFEGEQQLSGNPALSTDGRLLLFNHIGSANESLDLWYATRASAADPFVVVGVVPGLNSNAYEGRIYLSPDGCDVYFNSNRDGRDGIYHSRIDLR